MTDMVLVGNFQVRCDEGGIRCCVDGQRQHKEQKATVCTIFRLLHVHGDWLHWQPSWMEEWHLSENILLILREPFPHTVR